MGGGHGTKPPRVAQQLRQSASHAPLAVALATRLAKPPSGSACMSPKWIALLLAVAGAPLAGAEPQALLLKPDQVFDGSNPVPHRGWQVLVRGERIEAAGPSIAV